VRISQSKIVTANETFSNQQLQTQESVRIFDYVGVDVLDSSSQLAFQFMAMICNKCFGVCIYDRVRGKKECQHPRSRGTRNEERNKYKNGQTYIENNPLQSTLPHSHIDHNNSVAYCLSNRLNSLLNVVSLAGELRCVFCHVWRTRWCISGLSDLNSEVRVTSVYANVVNASRCIGNFDGAPATPSYR